MSSDVSPEKPVPEITAAPQPGTVVSTNPANNAVSAKPRAGYLDTTEFLILEDGRILVHNLTPEFARLLTQLAPEDTLLQQRANSDLNQ
jgi:hypothetical protein